MKRLIKKHSDVITVREELEKIRKSYISIGYEVNEINMNMFSINLDDGKVYVIWENNGFYEVIK